MTVANMSTGYIMRLLRLQEELNQGQAAKLLGVSRTYLCQIETGKKKPSLSFLKRFAELFVFPLPLLLIEEQSSSTLACPALEELFSGHFGMRMGMRKIESCAMTID